MCLRLLQLTEKKVQMLLDTETALPANSPPCFHLLAKPSGAACNIDCKYCFFLSRESLYPNDKQRTSEDTLETHFRQLLESHRTPQVAHGATI
jgi:uncharacterized protein